MLKVFTSTCFNHVFKGRFSSGIRGRFRDKIIQRLIGETIMRFHAKLSEFYWRKIGPGTAEILKLTSKIKMRWDTAF